MEYQITESIIDKKVIESLRKLNYRIDKKIKLDKENWIVTENHHEAIISKEDFDKV